MIQCAFYKVLKEQVESSFGLRSVHHFERFCQLTSIIGSCARSCRVERSARMLDLCSSIELRSEVIYIS